MSELKSQIHPDMLAGSCGNSEPFALQVTDDSMEPEFKRRCVIVIDPGGHVSHGKYVLAKVENGYIFRQISIEDGRYFIQPLNPDYMHERREITLDAIEGVVVQQAAPNGRRKGRKRYD